jgi:hypothetical protein
MAEKANGAYLTSWSEFHWSASAFLLAERSLAGAHTLIVATVDKLAN